LRHDLLWASTLCSLRAPRRDHAGLQDILSTELPYVWLDEYIVMSLYQQNVHRIPTEGFEYRWDMSGELLSQGLVPASAAVDDRLIAAHGSSRPAAEAHNGSRLHRRTLAP
jgi:hypothetical protein